MREVQLPALTEVGGDVALSYPGHISDLVSFDVGLESLATVGGNVSLVLTTFNATVSGLDALAIVPGDLSIVSHGSDFTVFGLLDALTHRRRRRLLAQRPHAGRLARRARDRRQHAAGRRLLPEPRHDESLASVGGTLSIIDAGMFSELLVAELTGLSIGALELSANASLSDMSTTHLTVAPSAAIAITNNTTLCQADAQAFVAAQTAAGWTGTATVTGSESCP